MPVDRFKGFGGLPERNHTTPQRKVEYEGNACANFQYCATTVHALVQLIMIVVGLESLYSMCVRTVSFLYAYLLLKETL